MDINQTLYHSDQNVFYKIYRIIWKVKKCDSAINIIGGFHILLLKLNLLGLQQWWLKSTIIAESSVNQAAEGKHYSRAIRLHKQSLECLLRFQSEKIITDSPVDVMGKEKNIRYHPPPDSLNDLLSSLQWEVINKNLLNASDTMGK